MERRRNDDDPVRWESAPIARDVIERGKMTDIGQPNAFVLAAAVACLHRLATGLFALLFAVGMIASSGACRFPAAEGLGLATAAAPFPNEMAGR
jgi:hypothetical protein